MFMQGRKKEYKTYVTDIYILYTVKLVSVSQWKKATVKVMGIVLSTHSVWN